MYVYFICVNTWCVYKNLMWFNEWNSFFDCETTNPGTHTKYNNNNNNKRKERFLYLYSLLPACSHLFFLSRLYMKRTAASTQFRSITLCHCYKRFLFNMTFIITLNLKTLKAYKEFLIRTILFIWNKKENGKMSERNLNTTHDIIRT